MNCEVIVVDGNDGRLRREVMLDFWRITRGSQILRPGLYGGYFMSLCIMCTST